VVGFKPSFGVLPLEGVLPFAPSLDTAGLFTETADDMRVLWERMGFAVGAPETKSAATFGPLDAEPEMEAAFRESIGRLRTRGFTIHAIDPPPGWTELLAASRLLNQYEGARTHEELWRRHGERMGRRLSGLIKQGLEISEPQYRQALAHIGAM